MHRGDRLEQLVPRKGKVLKMSCLNKRHGVNRGNKRGSYKYTEGFKDTSSVGSLMDETDREVSSLTDRAFKSLCIDEEPIYSDSEVISSPSGRKQAFTEDTQSKEVGGVTFSHSFVNTAKQEHISWNDHVHHLNNGAIESGWLQNRGKSKVSSLVKAFTTMRNDIKGGLIADRDMSESVTGRKQTDANFDSWDKTALLSIQRELSEFSTVPDPQNFKMGNSSTKGRSGTSKAQKTNKDLTFPSSKSSKNKSRKPSKHKKLNSNNFFLHSEFSPFQAWRECCRFPFEQQNMSNLSSANDFPEWYDSPLYKELTAATRLTQTGDSKKHRKSTDNVSLPALTFPKNLHKALDAEKPCSSPEEQQKIVELEKQVLSSKELNKTLTSENSCTSPKDPPNAIGLVEQNLSPNDLDIALTVEKGSGSEAGVPCPPWRRNRSLVRKAPIATHSSTVPPSHPQSRTGEEALATTSQDPTTADESTSGSITPFSISQLLTPIIYVGQKVESSGKPKEMLSPSELMLPELPESEIRPTPEVKLTDSYKAIASSLLFNIKDNRKRVKSTYSPQKFKGLNPKDPRRLLPVQETTGPKNVLAISEASIAVVSAAAHPKAGHVKSVSSHALEPKSERTGDRKKLADTRISDDYLTLTSPRSVKEAAGCRSFPGGMQEDAGRAHLAEVLNARSLPTSNEPSKLRVGYLAFDPPRTARQSGKQTENVPLKFIAPQHFAVAKHKKAHVGRKGPLMNGIISIKGPEHSGEEVRQSKQGLHVNRHGMIINRGVHAMRDEDNIKTAGDREVISSEPKDICLLSLAEQEEDNGFVRTGDQEPKSKVEASEDMEKVKKELNNGKETRKEVGAEHVFSSRQNQYIKNERYAVQDDEDEEASTPEPTAKGENIKITTSVQEYQKAKRGVVSQRVNKQAACDELAQLDVQHEAEGDVPRKTEERLPRSDVASANGQRYTGKHGPLSNGCMLDRGGELENEEVKHAKLGTFSAKEASHLLGIEREVFATEGYGTNEQKCTQNEQSRIHDADLTEQVLVRTPKDKCGESDDARINGLIKRNVLASTERNNANQAALETTIRPAGKVQDKGGVNPINGKYLTGKDKCAVEGKEHEKKSNNVDRVMMARGSVKQKVLSYMKENIHDKCQKLAPKGKELSRNFIPSTGILEAVRHEKFPTKQKELLGDEYLGKIPQDGSLTVRESDLDECDLVTMKEKVGSTWKENASKGNVEWEKLAVQERDGVSIKKYVAEEKVHTTAEVSAADGRAAAAAAVPAAADDDDYHHHDHVVKETDKKVQENDEQIQEGNDHKGQNRLSGVTLPLQIDNTVDEHTTEVMGPSIPQEDSPQCENFQLPGQNLLPEETKNASGKDRKELEKMELQCYSNINQESEREDKDRLVTSPQTDGSASWTEGSERSPSEMDEGGWVRCLIDCAKVQSQSLQSSAPLSPVGKLTLFKVKDNTFRNSPITKTVKLTFHHSFPEDFSLGSPRESLSGSERGEDERGLTKGTTGASVPRSTSPDTRSNGMYTPGTLRGRRRSHIQHTSIPEEDESRSFASGQLEDMESCALSGSGTEEAAISAAPAEDTAFSKEPSERSGSACSANDSQSLIKPPAVPPKTEKALRRAQKLTSRRMRKEEAQSKAQESSRSDLNPSHAAQNTVSPPSKSLVAQQTAPAPEPAPIPSAEPQIIPPPAADISVPSYAITQRKLLQDPDSGQYFVVDMPVQVKTKTFFDPELGTYVQLPVQSPKEASSTVAEAAAAPYMLCHGFVPIPVSSLPQQGPTAKALGPVLFPDTLEKQEDSGTLRQDPSKWVDCKDAENDIDPNITHVPASEKCSYSEEKDSIGSEYMDVVSLGEPDNCSVESS